MADSATAPGAPRGGNLTWHAGAVTAEDRARLLAQRGCVVWFTGLSGSGKSTVARELEAALLSRGRLCYVLDGDNVRHGLNADLGFAPEDRRENIRRIGEVAALFADAGLVTLVAFISPYAADRARARAAAGDGRFIEVYLDVPLSTCEERDPKGLYAKAHAGEIEDFTGVSAPYEAPQSPEIAVDTSETSAQEAAGVVLVYLTEAGLLNS